MIVCYVAIFLHLRKKAKALTLSMTKSLRSASDAGAAVVTAAGKSMLIRQVGIEPSYRLHTINFIDNVSYRLCILDRSMVEWIERLLLKRSAWVRFQVASNQKLENLVLTAFRLDVHQWKGTVWSLPMCGSLVGRWAGGSLSRRPKSPFAVPWPMQQDEWKCNCIIQRKNTFMVFKKGLCYF